MQSGVTQIAPWAQSAAKATIWPVHGMKMLSHSADGTIVWGWKTERWECGEAISRQRQRYTPFKAL